MRASVSSPLQSRHNLFTSHRASAAYVFTFEGVEARCARHPEQGLLWNLGGLLRVLQAAPDRVFTVPIDRDSVLVDLPATLHVMEAVAEISEAHLARALRLAAWLLSERLITTIELRAAKKATATNEKPSLLGMGGDA